MPVLIGNIGFNKRLNQELGGKYVLYPFINPQGEKQSNQPEIMVRAFLTLEITKMKVIENILIVFHLKI